MSLGTWNTEGQGGWQTSAPFNPIPVAAPVDVTVKSPTVIFRKINASALVQQLEGPEPKYPVYTFGSTRKFERPEHPGNEYRWLDDQEDF